MDRPMAWMWANGVAVSETCPCRCPGRVVSRNRGMQGRRAVQFRISIAWEGKRDAEPAWGRQTLRD